MPSCLHISKSAGLRGTCTIPGDKSISHRSVILGSIATGTSQISNFLLGGDCLATVDAMRSLAVQIEIESTNLVVHGRGLGSLKASPKPVDCRNSGTTMRLLAGLLAGQHFESTLIGTEQLSNRPMSRIVRPLEKMGARIESTSGTAPLKILGSRADLRGIRHEMEVASAQVKSCILLAGLYADDKTVVIEKGPSRDHTERMLASMGVNITTEGKTITLVPPLKSLDPLSLTIPGDMSSAAFLMVAASIVPDSEITIRNVGMNPTRTGILNALKRMNAEIEIENETVLGGEPVADLTVRTSRLKGNTFEGDEIVTMIDELPTLAVAAANAKGKTTIRGARELRVKETDRIATTANELRKLGVRIEELDDGMIIEGESVLKSAVVQSMGDHRLAMLLAVAGLVAAGRTTIENAAVTQDSFPGFETCLTSLGAPVEMSEK